ncbi:MAG: Abi family protein [Oscillospiraceae bacterium]|jgi:abortive infection bacteriophage resistance protein|nr:Abi family protein [Oscillospiraceae bacterium]
MLKKPATYAEQLRILKKRNLDISDDDEYTDYLERVNYYRFSAYLIPFRKPDGLYREGTKFCDICRIYEFDRKIRHVLLSALEEAEIYFRAKIAYVFAHKYGAEGYQDNVNFNIRHSHPYFERLLEGEIDKHSQELFVAHHLVKYNGKFPIWVAIEMFTFGMLSRFYSDMKLPDRKEISHGTLNTIPWNFVRRLFKALLRFSGSAPCFINFGFTIVCHDLASFSLWM